MAASPVASAAGGLASSGTLTVAEAFDKKTRWHERSHHRSVPLDVFSGRATWLRKKPFTQTENGYYLYVPRLSIKGSVRDGA